jgi:hypothetical protein
MKYAVAVVAPVSVAVLVGGLAAIVQTGLVPIPTDVRLIRCPFQRSFRATPGVPTDVPLGRTWSILITAGAVPTRRTAGAVEGTPASAAE